MSLLKKVLLSSIFITLSVFAAESKKMTVYKSPYCECCTAWIEIMKSHGFDVETIKINDVTPIKRRVGISDQLSSCHTAIVDGYVVEGHVPYSAVKKMLAEKPNIIGITVPGMPAGSPGMEQGNVKQHYNVYAVNQKGQIAIYEKH